MSDNILEEWREEKLAELRYLRACIHQWAGGNMPGTEAMRNFRELAAELRAQQDGYAKWRTGPRDASAIFHWRWPRCP